jgi:hypothetical protein
MKYSYGIRETLTRLLLQKLTKSLISLFSSFSLVQFGPAQPVAQYAAAGPAVQYAAAAPAVQYGHAVPAQGFQYARAGPVQGIQYAAAPAYQYAAAPALAVTQKVGYTNTQVPVQVQGHADVSYIKQSEA